MTWPKPVESPYLVPFDGSFKVARSPTIPDPDAPSVKECGRRLEAVVDEIRGLQRILYARDHRALLMVFQAMDAAGKDSTIRHVTTGVNPAGFQVYSFKAPSKEELDHDFLWRSTVRLPERGRIGIFNRSYYEEVLVVRVHPAILEGQRIPGALPTKDLWNTRLESIRDHERHLARNGTVVLKFWLNVSKEEQLRRFLRRIDNPDKNWKFSSHDVEERGYWDRYMEAYEEAIRHTSREWAPWYAIPADSKPHMRLAVATIIRDTLVGLGLRYPELSEEERVHIEQLRARLESEG